MSETTNMEIDKNSTEYRNDEITLKQVILTIQEYWKELWRNWKKIVLIGLLCISYFLYQHFTTPLTYTAKVKFLVEGEGSGVGGLAGLARQFGFGNSTGGKANPYKILEVATSNKLNLHLLTHEFKDTLLGNLIIKEYNLWNIWEKDGMKNFLFKKKIDLNEEGSRLAFNEIHNLLWGSEEDRSESLMSIKYNDEKGIFTIGAMTTNEQLSVSLVNKLYEEIKQFFEYKIFENQLSTKKILQLKVDSLSNLRQQKNYQLASFEDSNRNLVDRKASVKRSILSQDITAINIVYGEALKNLELADLTLRDIQPFFMLIESPIPPIKPRGGNLILAIFFGLVLGFMISSIYFLSMKFFRDLMKNE